MTYKVTDTDRAVVQALASYGMPVKKIAAYVGISKATLYKYYEDVLAKSKLDKIMHVADALFYNATEKGNVTAQIFYLKTQGCELGWRETEPKNDEEDNNVETIEIKVIKPEAKQ